MSKSMPGFFSALSRDLGQTFELQIDSDGFDECINELAESFVAFIQGQYIEASEVKFYCQKNNHFEITNILFLIAAHELD
jgi:hypothetical protein